MNKIIRILVPVMIAFLFISLLIWLVGESSLVTAASSLTTTEGAKLVTMLEDELNSNGYCASRKGIQAANIDAERYLPGKGCGQSDTYHRPTEVLPKLLIVIGCTEVGLFTRVHSKYSANWYGYHPSPDFN